MPYWAPEVFETGPGLPNDMWGLGVIIYMLLTAGHPFDDNGQAEEATIKRHILNGEGASSPPPPAPRAASARALTRAGRLAFPAASARALTLAGRLARARTPAVASKAAHEAGSARARDTVNIVLVMQLMYRGLDTSVTRPSLRCIVRPATLLYVPSIAL